MINHLINHIKSDLTTHQTIRSVIYNVYKKCMIEDNLVIISYSCSLIYKMGPYKNICLSMLIGNLNIIFHDNHIRIRNIIKAKKEKKKENKRCLIC